MCLLRRLPKKDEINTKIYTIRGMQVMLDRDLAVLYEVETRSLKQAVNRNKKRFPADFMFILDDQEINSLVSQSVIPSKKVLGGAKPYAFTEQGVASLSAVLSSDKAIDAHIQIMRAFVELRNIIRDNSLLYQRIENIEGRLLITDSKLEEVFQAIEDKKIQPEQGIFFEGQVFDAYVFVSQIIKQAKESIILIDNYVDESVLTLLSKRAAKCSAVIFTKKISNKLRLDVDKHNAQYAPVEVREFSDAHDRFLIVDGKDVYHIGASLKDLGKKWFAFSKLEKSNVLEIFKRLGEELK